MYVKKKTVNQLITDFKYIYFLCRIYPRCAKIFVFEQKNAHVATLYTLVCMHAY